ncbi:hypothetical protein RCL_jg28986.t1 [Rhizophagus clarus]|uniref:Uncharacterized protein n=1 Tax=Rhizophagus clarus TaxID=94130 RepID=A0A8H3QUH2_9GLOM|nr:hypothetical protein RCL_jg28986.t1 [Rhizophagus clarus]
MESTMQLLHIKNVIVTRLIFFDDGFILFGTTNKEDSSTSLFIVAEKSKVCFLFGRDSISNMWCNNANICVL